MWDVFADIVGEDPEQLEGDLTDYLVCDTLDRQIGDCQVLPRTVLLCESPHKDEVIHGHALAGLSGLNVTKRLGENHDFNYPVCPASPIGCLILRESHRVLNSIGLMNVSQLPLQGKAYSCDLHRYSGLFDEFENIKAEAEKTNGDRKLKNEIGDRPVWKAIGEDLCRRLVELAAQCRNAERNIEIVPCGAVARAYLCWARSRACLGDLQRYSRKVPHPTSWARVKGSKLEQIRVLVGHICARQTN